MPELPEWPLNLTVGRSAYHRLPRSVYIASPRAVSPEWNVPSSGHFQCLPWRRKGQQRPHVQQPERASPPHRNPQRQRNPNLPLSSV